MNPLKHTNEVHMFIDETFLYRDEAGNYSWYLACEPDFNCWAKGVGSLPHTRWGIVQALFTWWEYPYVLPPGTEPPELTPYGRVVSVGRGRGRGRGAAPAGAAPPPGGRGRGRGDGAAPAGAAPPGYGPVRKPGKRSRTFSQEKVPQFGQINDGGWGDFDDGYAKRRFLQTEETLGTWNCSLKNGNFNSVKFLQWLRSVLEFTVTQFPGKIVIIHLDNAKCPRALL